jgi:hypothetical protein
MEGTSATIAPGKRHDNKTGATVLEFLAYLHGCSEVLFMVDAADEKRPIQWVWKGVAGPTRDWTLAASHPGVPSLRPALPHHTLSVIGNVHCCDPSSLRFSVFAVLLAHRCHGEISTHVGWLLQPSPVCFQPCFIHDLQLTISSTHSYCQCFSLFSTAGVSLFFSN